MPQICQWRAERELFKIMCRHSLLTETCFLQCLQFAPCTMAKHKHSTTETNNNRHLQEPLKIQFPPPPFNANTTQNITRCSFLTRNTPRLSNTACSVLCASDARAASVRQPEAPVRLRQALGLTHLQLKSICLVRQPQGKWPPREIRQLWVQASTSQGSEN